jgi:hypothetical protein
VDRIGQFAFELCPRAWLILHVAPMQVPPRSSEYTYDGIHSRLGREARFAALSPTLDSNEARPDFCFNDTTERVLRLTKDILRSFAFVSRALEAGIFHRHACVQFSSSSTSSRSFLTQLRCYRIVEFEQVEKDFQASLRPWIRRGVLDGRALGWEKWDEGGIKLD